MSDALLDVHCKYLNFYILGKGNIVDFLSQLPIKTDDLYLYYSNIFGQVLFDRDDNPIIAFKINRHTGKWYDLKNQTYGDDLIDLFKAQKKLSSKAEAFNWLLTVYRPKDLLFLLKVQL
jgi:hypothetical protein